MVGSLEVIKKKLIFVQRSPFDSMEESFFIMVFEETNVLVCFLVWKLPDSERVKEQVSKG